MNRLSKVKPVPEQDEQKKSLTPEERRREEDHRRLAEMSGTGGATPEERKSTLDRLFNLQIPSIQPKAKTEDSNPSRRSGGSKLKAALNGLGKEKPSENVKKTEREQEKKKAPYSMRFGIDFDADIPEEEEIDTDIKGGDDL